MMSWILSGLIVTLVALFYRAYRNTHDVTVKREQIGETEHPDAALLHVLHLSDLHLENISISPEQLFEKLKDERIDMIALTGDFLDRKRTIPKLIPYLEQLNNLNPSYGIYAVFGNHDYVLRSKSFDHLRNVLQENGCATLQNENVTIEVGGLPVNIIGIDDHGTGRSDIRASYTGVESGYRLILTHDPNIVLDMQEPFDYLLSGHFHGGQICWPKPYHLVKMGKLARSNVIKGLHYKDGKPFYISEGLGQTGLNIRVGSRPEITLHRLAIPPCGMAQDRMSAVV